MPFREPSQLRPSCQDALKPSDYQIGGKTDQQHERNGHHDILHLLAPEQQRNALRPKHQTALVIGAMAPPRPSRAGQTRAERRWSAIGVRDGSALLPSGSAIAVCRSPGLRSPLPMTP